VGRVFRSLPVFTAELPLHAVPRIAALARVRRVSSDRAATACWDYNGGTVGADVAAAQYGVDGRGIGVAWGEDVPWTGSLVWGDLPVVSGDPSWQSNVVWAITSSGATASSSSIYPF
jgi:hypothetical protein